MTISEYKARFTELANFVMTLDINGVYKDQNYQRDGEGFLILKLFKCSVVYSCFRAGLPLVVSK